MPLRSNQQRLLRPGRFQRACGVEAGAGHTQTGIMTPKLKARQHDPRLVAYCVAAGVICSM